MSDINVQSRYLTHIEVGRLTADWSAKGDRILRYRIDFTHLQMEQYKALSAPALYILQNKVDALLSSWDRAYDERLRRDQLFSDKARADQATIDAANALENVLTLLNQGLAKCAAIDWEQLKSRAYFSKTYNKEPQPSSPALLPEPVLTDPHISFWAYITGKAGALRRAAADDHRLAEDAWNASERSRRELYAKHLRDWQIRCDVAQLKYEQEKHQFYDEQRADNDKIDVLARGVMDGDSQAIIDQMTLVLDRSDYGGFFEKDFEIGFDSNQKMLLIEYQLPSPEDMPSIKTVRFIKTTGEIKETYISDREQQSNFDTTCYQICLRTLYEVFDADINKNVERVLFNGHSRHIDKATGQDVQACIMSIIVDRVNFATIDLSRIEPKVCFKGLKGVSASSLSALAPIPPILKLNKNDSRFIEGRDAIGELDEATNLAAMDWEDFEHLVRQLFEREFSARGGEVKVTQSSSDGGVDAVAFDPDPITGGKIVIQAKRYTKTVGVSAIRDLYGTMQHESASRGILVTTADFGPDAHKFASGKPITLMTGANLLHLLQKHGINAKIDVLEARKVLNLREYSRRQ